MGAGFEYLSRQHARVAELADAQDLGSCGETRGGSTPLSRTIPQKEPRRGGCSHSFRAFVFRFFGWQGLKSCATALTGLIHEVLRNELPLTLILSPHAGRGDFPSPFPRERVRVRVRIVTDCRGFKRIVNNPG